MTLSTDRGALHVEYKSFGVFAQPTRKLLIVFGLEHSHPATPPCQLKLGKVHHCIQIWKLNLHPHGASA
jgi:hypothetical protein